MTAWQRVFGLFALFNLIAVPLAGELTGLGMSALLADGQRALAVVLSVVATAAILAVNVLIIRAAARADMPRKLEAGLAFFTLIQFAVTIGFGIFSLVTFITALPSLFAWATG